MAAQTRISSRSNRSGRPQAIAGDLVPTRTDMQATFPVLLVASAGTAESGELASFLRIEAEAYASNEGVIHGVLRLPTDEGIE